MKVQHKHYSVCSYTQILHTLPCTNSFAEFIKSNVKAQSVSMPYPNICVHQPKHFTQCCCQSLCLKVCLQNHTLLKIYPYNGRIKYIMGTKAMQRGQIFWINPHTKWIFFFSVHNFYPLFLTL
jgi:hypothetical protein